MKYSCNHMMCHMNKDINEDPMYWLGSSFFSGVLFSYWSWGILYLLAFLIIRELAYYLYCYAYKGLTYYDLMIRIGIVSGALMGFLIGRAITENDDHEKSIEEFWGSVRRYTGYKYPGYKYK